MTIELKYTLFTHPYLVLRKAVGWIGILLPFTLILGVLFLFNGEVIQSLLAIIITPACVMCLLGLSVLRLYSYFFILVMINGIIWQEMWLVFLQ